MKNRGLWSKEGNDTLRLQKTDSFKKPSVCVIRYFLKTRSTNDGNQ